MRKNAQQRQQNVKKTLTLGSEKEAPSPKPEPSTKNSAGADGTKSIDTRAAFIYPRARLLSSLTQRPRKRARSSPEDRRQLMTP